MGSQLELVNMVAKVVFLSLFLLAGLTFCQDFKKHNLPVLFQYEEPGHSVAVFRGAELKQAIAAGLVPGFGNLGRQGKVLVDDSADDMAAAKAAAAAEARDRAAAAKAAADARAAEEARQARSRTSQLDSAEQACIQACKNLVGQCRNPFA